MPRVKRGKAHLKRRKNLLSKAKVFRGGRKNLPKLTKVAVTKAGVHAYSDRRKKKRTRRGLWQIKINAAIRGFDLSYSKFMGLLHKNNIEIDRKILADLAEHHPKAFAKIVEKVKA